MRCSLIAAAALLACAGCKESKTVRAEAHLEPKSGSEARGHATFVEAGGGVQVTVTIEGATPGRHGLHLHERGDCSAPDAESAGGHWNPDQAVHGAPGSPAHAGDLGNIEIGADGKGRLQITISRASVRAGSHSVAGKAVVLHAAPDDLMTQPAGNAGPRVACGVVGASG